MNPLYHRTRFVMSVPNPRQAPPDQGYEVAFAGRSNAGKSSALNLICQQSGLARTSKTPGRTQQLVFFQVDDARRLVDLPGYGYAKVPQPIQAEWRGAMEYYLSRRLSLRGLFIIMDIRHPLTDYDQQLIGWCEYRGLPIHVLLTKADKLGYGAQQATLLKTRRALQEFGMPIGVQIFSALAKTGVDEAHAMLDHWLETAGPTPTDS